MFYGGDYYPEQWPESVWRDDIALMREAGVTMVTVGVFAWARFEPADGEFDFDWSDRLLDLLHDAGIAVDLATATASPPPWASADHPELLAQTADGAVYWPGSRQHYAPSSPEYRRLASRLVTRIAERYAAHPAVVLWHVNNEYGNHVDYDYSDAAAAAFRRWLRAKYGDVDALNAAWGTLFWAQRYRTFDEIVPPRRTPTSPNPGGLLDFKRYTSDALLELFLMEKRIIRDAGATQPVTTNFMGAFHPVDYRAWAPHLDVIADDSYPDPNHPESFRAAAFTRDLMRSLKPTVPWMLMEQSSGAVNWRRTNAPKAPGQMAALSMQAVGRGADAVLFFQWRQSTRGSERFHAAMLPHAGTGTRVWREVVALGNDLGRLPQLPAAGSRARVALLLDWENWWAISGADHPNAVDYGAIVMRWHAALQRAHVAVDIVGPASDLRTYALVIAPQLYLLRDATAEALTDFVRAGGLLLLSAFTDVVDEDDAFRPGGFTTRLREVLGLHVLEFGALVPPPPDPGHPVDPASVLATLAAARDSAGESVALVRTPWGVVRGGLFAEELEVRGAEVIGRFEGGRLDGAPALTTHAYGAGRAVYLATVPDREGLDRLVPWALDAAGVAPLISGAPEEVEVAVRGDVVSVINQGATAAQVTLPGVDLLRDQRVDTFELGPYDYRFIRQDGG